MNAQNYVFTLAKLTPGAGPLILLTRQPPLTQASASEAAAVDVQQQLQMQSLPTKQYLETTVVPILLDGLQALVRERRGSSSLRLPFMLGAGNRRKPFAQLA